MSILINLCCFFLLFQNFHCLVIYNITSSTPLLANQTLLSSSETFEFGFFTPNETTGNQYVGIRLKSLSPPKIVWLANREKPLMSYNGEPASLRVETDGNLNLVDGQQNTIWSTNISINSSNTYVELSNNGNLVLKNINSDIVLWQSFDYPCDTLLPGMQIGIDVGTGKKKYLVSWKNDNDPSRGNFVLGITPETPPQAITWNGSLPYWRAGQWDKTKFVGIEEMTESYNSLIFVQQDPKKTYVTMRENPEASTWLVFLSPKGLLQFIQWNNGKAKYYWEAPDNPCEIYGTCGPFGICSASSSPICRCLTGFVPKSLEEWNSGNWTGGCIRETTLNCERSMTNTTSEDEFQKMSIVKLPNSAKYMSDPADAQQCLKWCLSNCSCQAYSFLDSVGCMVWTEPLMDMEQFNSSGRDLFIRLADIDSDGAKQTRKLIISLTSIAIVIIMGLVAYGLCKRRTNQKKKRSASQNLCASENMTDTEGELQQGNMCRQQLEYDTKSELPLFRLATILAATNNFSVIQKLGQGGFGPVYKGKLDDGRDVAVKRLSSSSEQGMQEFKNEIVLISKLQHRNLVKLVGYCIQEEEKILVYEYLPNKSLDTYLFDSTRKIELDWDKRFNIIQGVARGLVYLHKDSSLRVIHRDLKASNILLDENMNPKISDFGLARMFQGTQVLVNTCKVVGTLGYMSPEYALGGMFSEKSDVYSFGVLLLEIVSGKKNSTIYSKGESLSLLSYAWQLWSQGKGLEFMDETLVAKSPKQEILKCIHIGLLCVQDHTNDRPNMPTVVLMLSGQFDLPQAKQPTFICQSLTTNEITWHEDRNGTINTITNSIVLGR